MCTIGYGSEFDALNLDFRIDYQKDDLKLIVGATYGEDSLTSKNRPNFFNFLKDVNAAVGSAPNYFNPGGAFGAKLPLGSLPTGITATNNFDQDRTSWALYGEGNYAFTETFNLTLGLRYSKDTLEYSDGYTTYYDDAGNARLLTVSGNTVGGAFAPYFLDGLYDMAGNLIEDANSLNAGNPYPGPLGLKDGSESVSGRLIADWAVTDEAMVYASYSRGYRAGTINGLAYGSANQIYFVPPEEVDAYEVGFKSRFYDGRVQLNGAIFLYDYTGQQGQVVDQSATANLVSFDGEIRGLELDAQFAVLENLTLTAAIGMLDSEYDGDSDSCDGVDLTGKFPAQEGSCVLSSGGPVSVGGNQFPYAPDLTINLGFDWDIAEIADGTMKLHGDAAYTGQFYYDSFEEYDRGVLTTVATGDFTEGEGEYWTYNARLSYETNDYSIALWGKNLTDEEYYPFGISIENLFGNGYRVLGAPRTYGAEVKFFF